MATRRISATARRRTRRNTGEDLSPMSLLQGPDEPKSEPMPGPELTYGCSNCHHLPLGPDNLFLAMAAVMVVLSGAVALATMQIDSLGTQVTAFNGLDVSR